MPVRTLGCKRRSPPGVAMLWKDAAGAGERPCRCWSACTASIPDLSARIVPSLALLLRGHHGRSCGRLRRRWRSLAAGALVVAVDDFDDEPQIRQQSTHGEGNEPNEGGVDRNVLCISLLLDLERPSTTGPAVSLRAVLEGFARLVQGTKATTLGPVELGCSTKGRRAAQSPPHELGGPVPGSSLWHEGVVRGYCSGLASTTRHRWFARHVKDAACSGLEIGFHAEPNARRTTTTVIADLSDAAAGLGARFSARRRRSVCSSAALTTGAMSRDLAGSRPV